MKPDLRDVFVFGGLVLASLGAGLVFMPAGLIVPGLALFWLGTRRV